ncbi:MAG: hypothetical protein JW700_01735, partial [Candidatus Aenigmarchaeota archaeon]|nr:hypothetical protein [Candidatus Aenigmarchaeota archaeon]
MKSSAKSGQSQLLVPLLVIITSAVVFATNVTMNWTNSTPITGNYLGMPDLTSQEFTFLIEVMANTSISLSIDDGLMKAVLLMDNGTAIPNQRIDFFLNETPLYSDTTNSDGIIDFPLPFNGTIKAVFSGGNYLNPTESHLNLIDLGKEADFSIDSESFELEILESGHEEIEIGKPVKWVKKFKVTNKLDEIVLTDIDLEIPESAFNVSLLEKETKKSLKIEEKSLKEELKADESKEYELEYYTESPIISEIPLGQYKKLVNVSSPLHYFNVPASTDIGNFPENSIKLYWISDDQRIDVTEDEMYNLSMLDIDQDGLIDKLKWNVPHLSEQIFEVSIEVLNPYTYLKDADDWIVAFETFGTANLTINSTNASWTEFLKDTTETFNEMKFIDIMCGEISLRNSLKLIDFSGNVYNYSDLSQNDSLEIEHLLIENYSCNETAYLTNNMIKSGYATLQFTFGDQVAYAYDPPGYTCQKFTNAVQWGAVGAGSVTYEHYNWTYPDLQPCPGVLNCYISNISVFIRYMNAGTKAGGTDQGWVKVANTTQRNLDPNSASFTNARYSARNWTQVPPGDYFGPQWECGSNTAPNTCEGSLTLTSGYNASDYYSIEVMASGAGGANQKIVTDVYTINYTWCWIESEPELIEPVVNDTESGFSAGWGTTFNFSVNVTDPQRDTTNVSLWYTPTAGTGFVMGGSNNVTGPMNDSYGNMTNITQKFLCSGGTIYDAYSNDLGVLGAAKYYKFNASDYAGGTDDTYYTYGNIYFTPVKDYVDVTNLTPTESSIINRTDTTQFVVRVYDKDNQSYDGGQSGKIWVSTYAFDQNTSFLTSTNSTGHLSQIFTNAGWCEDESKYYLGVHHWGGGTQTDACVQNNNTNPSNFTLMGTLYNTLNDPDGSSNFTQGQTIDFSATVIDDCGNSRTADSTINITMSNEGTEYWCIASAAGECSIDTDISYPTGWYNVTINSSKNYYNNDISLDQDVFYLEPQRMFYNATVNPDSAYFSNINWNFSVNATSGNSDQMNITLYLRKGSGSYSECTECEAQTSTTCTNCINQTYFWYRNFTEDDAGTWYYQFRMYNHTTSYLENQTTEQSFYVDLEPDIKIYLDDITQDPSSAQWGGTPFTFNTTVSTTGINDVDVFLWVGDSAIGPWTFIDSMTYDIGEGGLQTLNWTNYFDCPDIGTKYFFFNATNNNLSTNSTTPQSFTITKDTIYLNYEEGHNSTANRLGDQTDLLVFRATNYNGTNMANFPIKYSVTTGNTTVTYYSDSNFVNETNSTGYSNFYFNPTCLDEYAGAPKFQVREQQWKAEINDSELSCYYQNTSSDYLYRNISVKGNILITLNNPDGSTNVTQLGAMTFLGYSYDDCEDALRLNTTAGYEEVKYYANDTLTSGYDCGQSTLIGANAYQCNWQTDIDTPVQFYNASMFVNKSGYYTNSTLEDAERGWLFYVSPFREFSNKTITPISDLWDRINWNFSVNATSGDYNNETIVLQLKQGSGAWQNCEDVLDECYNMTPTNCTHCVNETYFWYANFTEDDAGT